MAASIEETLMRFWPALERKREIGWCVVYVRDGAGVKREERQHPGFS